MKRKALLTHIPEQELPKQENETQLEDEKVTAVSQVTSYDGQQYLNIDLFYHGQLKARYFTDRLTYASCVGGQWKTCKLDNVARICAGKAPLYGNETYYYAKQWKWNSDEDKKRAEQYLGTTVEWYEDCVNQEKYNKAYQRKQKRVENLMATVPALPDALETWLKEKIFPQNYLFMKKGKKRTDYSCTACGCKSWKKKGWKHNERITCPKCGRPVIAYSRKTLIQKKEPVVVLQMMGAYDWAERQLKAICTWDSGHKEIEILEEIRVIIPKNKTWGKVWYGQLLERDEFEQEFWETNGQNKRFLKSYLYPGTLQEALPYGNLQHSGLDILAERCEKVNVNSFITTFHARPWLEYWIKGGLYRLTVECIQDFGMWGNPSYIRTNEKKLSSCLRISGDRVYRLKSMNGGLAALKWLQHEQNTEKKISQESLEFLNKKAVGPGCCKKILQYLGSVNRMVNYMKKQKIDPNRLVQTWEDYLRMAAEEGLDLTDDIVRLPKDLKARHDELVARINARIDAKRLKDEKEKYKKLDHGIMQHLPEARHYFWEDETYIIIPAGTCRELIEEGQTLHHCVGATTTYMEKMANGKSWILFLRKKKELKKPYYTIEIDMEDNHIMQWYSEYDRKPDQKKIEAVLRKFKNSLRRKNRIAV